MRMIYRKNVTNAWVAQSRQSSHWDGKGIDETNVNDPSGKRTQAREGAVGDEVEGAGFGIGIASKDSKPTNKIENAKQGSPDPKHLQEQLQMEEDKLDYKEDDKDDLGVKRQVKELWDYIPRNQAFIEYKADEGKNTEQNIKANQDELKTKKEEFNNLKEQCNRAKNEIDNLKTQLDKKNDQKQKSLELEDEEDVIDEEEFNLIKEMKDYKKSYRNAFDRLKNVKGDIFLIQQNIDQLKQTLVNQFELWYEETFDTTEERARNVSIDLPLYRLSPLFLRRKLKRRLQQRLTQTL